MAEHGGGRAFWTASIAGGIGGFSGDGGQATLAELNRPARITFDVSGNLYISDYYNDRIRKVTNAAQINVQELEIKNELSIWPNPTNAILHIEFNVGQDPKSRH